MPLSERQRRFVRNIYSLISSGDLNSDEDTKRILQTAEESDPEFVGSLRQAWSEEKGPKVEDAGFWSEFRRGVARPGELKQELDAASAIPGLDARRYADSPSYSPGESGAMGVATGVLDAVPVLGRFVRTPREAAPAPNNAAARLGFAGTAAEATADVAPALVENLALILGTGGAAGALGASPAIASTLGLAAGSALTGGLPVDPEAERNVQNIARTGIDVVTGKIGGAAVERALGSKALKDIGLSRLLGAAGADAAIGAASAPLSVGADTASLKRNLNEMTPEERQQYAQIGPVSVRKPTVEEMALQAAFPTAELVGRVRARQAARAAGVRASLAADAASPGIDPFAETKAAAAKQDASRRIAEEAKSQQDAAREQAVRTPDWYARLTPEAARAELRDASDKGDSTRIETLLREAVAGPVLLRFGDGSEILGAVDGGEFVSQSGERAPLRSVADYVTFDDLERKRVEREASDLAARQIQRSDQLDIATAPTIENVPLPTQTDIPVPPDAQLALGDLTQQGQVEKPNPLEREFEKRVEQRGIVEGQRNQLLANPDPEVRRDTQVDLPIEWTQESARGRQAAAPMLEQSAQLDKPIEIAQEGKRGLRAAQKMLKQAATSKGVIQPNAGPTVPTATPKGGDLFGKEGRPQGRQEVLTDATGPADTGAPPTPVVFGNQSEQLARAAQRRAPIPVVARGTAKTMNVKAYGPQAGHYEVVNLDDMVPSHDPTTFNEDPRRRIQNTNDYTKASFMAQTMAGAKTLDPDQILIPGVYHEGGVPWVYPDGEVASGNGRTLMIKLARMIAPEKYAAFMDAQRKAAAQFGIDPALVKDGTQIVFKVDTTPEREVALIQSANVPHSKQTSVEDFGLGLSRVLKPEHFAELNLSDESTLRSELQTNGPRVIRGLIEKGVLSDTQATSLFTDGKGTKLNDQGLNMLESIVTGMAYDSPELRALIDSGGGKVRQVAERLLVPVANTKLAVANGNLPEVADLSKRMERVFRQVIDTGTGKKGVGGEEQSFLAGDEAPPDVVDEALVKLVTTAMTEKGGIGRLGPEVRKLGTMLEPYRTDAGQGDLVGGNELTGDVLAGMINRVERGVRLGPSLDRMESFVESSKAEASALESQAKKARGAAREVKMARFEEAKILADAGLQAMKEVRAELDGEEMPVRSQDVKGEIVDEYKRRFEQGEAFSATAILDRAESAGGPTDEGALRSDQGGLESGGAGRAAAPDDAAGSLDAGAGRADQPGDDGQSELAFKPRGDEFDRKPKTVPVYHYSDHAIDEFKDSPTGTWFTDNEVVYPRRPGESGRVRNSAYIDTGSLRLANETQATAAGINRGPNSGWVEALKAQGFDGVRLKVDGNYHYNIFDKKNILTQSPAAASNTDRSFAPRVKEPGVVYQEYDAFDGVTKTIRLGDVVKMPNGDFVKVSRETDPGTLVGAQVVFDKPTLFDGQSDLFAEQPVEEGRGPTGKTGAARERLEELDMFGDSAMRMASGEMPTDVQPVARKIEAASGVARRAGASEIGSGLEARRADLQRQVDAYRRMAEQQDAKPLERGREAISRALSQDRALDDRGRRFILETIDENPALFGDTAVVLTDDPNLPLGAYDAKRKLVTIARAATEGDLRTVGEELYHSLARFLPVEQQHAVLGEYGRALSRQLSHEVDMRQAAGARKNKAEWERRNSRIEFLKKAARGEAKVADASMAPDLYHLLDPDEYFADKMAEYRMVDFRRRERLSEYEKHLFGPLFKRAHEVFSAFWNKMKAVFGPETFRAYEGLKKAKAEASPNEFIRRVRVSDPAVWERFVGQKVSDAAGIPGETALAIRAYHGSPHKFDKFTTAAMGTGEGAQAYGWGLYFTGKKDIAEWYAKRLAENKSWQFMGRSVERPEDIGRIVEEKLKAQFGDMSQQLDDAKEAADFAFFQARAGYDDSQIQRDLESRYKGLIPSIRKAIINGIESVSPVPGSPWTVTVEGGRKALRSGDGSWTPEERGLWEIEQRLRWRSGKKFTAEEALADVRSEVERTIANIDEFEKKHGPVDKNPRDGESPDQFDRRTSLKSAKLAKTMFDRGGIVVEPARYGRNLYSVSLGKEGGSDPNLLKYDSPPTKDQADALMRIAKEVYTDEELANDENPFIISKERDYFEDMLRRSGKDAYMALVESFGSQKEASLALKRNGIDGIDYPAGTMSGGMDDGTRNYVIFDDSNVSVDEAVSFKPRPMDSEIERIIQEKGGVVPLERVGPTFLEKARDFIADVRQRGVLRAEVALMDATAAIRRFEEKNYKWNPKGKGTVQEGLEPGVSAWQQKMFASNAADQVAVAFEAHPLKLRRYQDDASGLEGSIVEIDKSKDGLAKILLPAEKAGMQRHVFQFMAAERAAEELARGTNGWRPYSEEEITTMRRLGEEEIADGVKVKDVAKQAHDWFRSFLDLAEAAGTINRAARAEWERTMYVPFFKKVEKAYADGSTWDDVIGPGGAPDMVNIADVIRPIKGKNAPINDVFENMIRMAQHLTEVSMKNLAGQKFVSEVEAVPEVSDIMRPLTEQELKDNGWRLKNKEWKSQEGIVSVLYDGEPKYFKVEDDLLYRGLVATGGPANWGRAEWLRRALQMGTQMVRFGATRNPVFALKNPVRDTLNAVAVGDEKRFVPFISTLSGYKSALMGDDRTLRVRAAGASQGGYFERGAAGLSKQLRRGLERKAGTRSGPVARLVDAYDAYEHFLASGEMASRVGLAEAIRARGGTDAEQIAGAQNLINYNLHGDSKLASLFTSTIPFLNARLAGFYRLGVAASAPTAKGEALNKFWRSAVMLGMASSVLSYFNWSQNGEYYDNLEEWDKDANWHFYIPSPTGGGPLHFKLPKPFEFGTVFGTFPERMFGFASEKSTDRGDTALLKERLGAAWKDIFNLPNPVNPLSALNQMALTRPYMEQTANKNFYSGKPIVPRGEDQAEPVSQYGGRTSRTARIFAGAVDKVPGDPQMLEWMRSPRRVEEMVRGYTGGLGLYALRMMDIGLDGLDWAGVVDLPPKAPREMRDVPIAGDVMRAFFTGDAGDEDGSRYVTKFYNELDDAAEAYLTLKRYRETGDAKKAREYASEKRDQLRKYAALQGSRDAIAGLNDQVRRTQESRSMTGEQKRDRQESLLKRKRRLAQRAVLGLRNRDQGSNSTGVSQ